MDLFSILVFIAVCILAAIDVVIASFTTHYSYAYLALSAIASSFWFGNLLITKFCLKKIRYTWHWYSTLVLVICLSGIGIFSQQQYWIALLLMSMIAVSRAYVFISF